MSADIYIYIQYIVCVLLRNQVKCLPWKSRLGKKDRKGERRRKEEKRKKVTVRGIRIADHRSQSLGLSRWEGSGDGCKKSYITESDMPNAYY